MLAGSRAARVFQRQPLRARWEQNGDAITTRTWLVRRGAVAPRPARRAGALRLRGLERWRAHPG